MPMIRIFCPRCSSSNLEEIGDGDYRCVDCGFVGSPLSGRGMIKQ
jgi:hypothetical protein